MIWFENLFTMKNLIWFDIEFPYLSTPTENVAAPISTTSASRSPTAPFHSPVNGEIAPHFLSLWNRKVKWINRAHKNLLCTALLYYHSQIKSGNFCFNRIKKILYIDATYIGQEPRLRSWALFRHVTESLRQTVAIFFIFSLNIAFILSYDAAHVSNLNFFDNLGLKKPKNLEKYSFLCDQKMPKKK